MLQPGWRHRSSSVLCAEKQLPPWKVPARTDHAAEAAILTGASVFAEFLAATGRAAVTPAQILDAVAAFAGLDPALGWAGNLRRRTGERVAIRRGGAAWRYDDIATSDAAWQAASGPCAQGSYEKLVQVTADHLLRADTRPDDTLLWRGDPEDPWPFGALIIGATLEFATPDA